MADRSGIKVTASDALEFESVAPKVRKGGGIIKTLMFALIAVLVGAGGWAYYGDHLMSLVNSADDEIPVIRADLSPIKVRPENPGGLQVPDRDKLVYDRILNNGSGETRATVERLLPPPETPLPVPESASASSARAEVAPVEAEPASPSIADTPRVSDVTTAIKPGPAPATPAVPEVPTTTANTTAPALNSAPNGGPTRLAKPPLSSTAETVPPPPALPKQTASTAPAPKPVQTATPAAVPGASSVATPSDKVYRVQLAAARTAEAARSEWDRLRRGNLDLLGDLGLSVTKIDLGGTKGIFYRLRAGPLSGDAQARALCKELAQRKIGCLVVRPGK